MIMKAAENIKTPLLAILSLFIFFLSSSFAQQPQNIPEDPLRLKELASKAALKGDWDSVREIVPALLEKDARLEDTFRPLLALAFLKKGEKDEGLKILENRNDLYSVLLRASILGEGLRLPGSEGAVKRPSIIIIETPSSNRAISLGVFPKAAERVALKEGFLGIVPEPTLEQTRSFEERIAGNPKSYFLSGDVLLEAGGRAICLAAVDTGRMAADLGLGGEKSVLRVGVVTRQGDDNRRKLLLKELASAGYEAEDLGRGDFYALGDRARAAGVVMEISEDSRSSGPVLKSSFKNIEGGLTVALYNPATGDSLAELKEKASIIHIDEESGRSSALVKCYERLLGGLKMKLDSIAASGLGRTGATELEVTVTANKVFSSNYKFYTRGPVGELVLKNNTDRPITNVKVDFVIKDYMDFPTQVEVGDIPPKETLKKDIKTVFNNRILDITEDTLLQSEIRVSAVARGKEETVTVTQPVYVYERHALVWDNKGKIASFITPKDPVIMNFAGQAASGYHKARVNKPLATARALFEALGVEGVAYMEDPNNPYQVISDLKDVVDYVQFPRETLSRKAGDCDDLTSLYAALLESLGIKTMLVDAPGHLFLLFDTGVTADDAALFGFSSDTYMIHEDTIWIPVETTFVGSSFVRAWKKGAEELREGRDSIRFIDMREAWQANTPPNFAPASFDSRVSRDAIEKRFPGEIESLEAQRASAIMRHSQTLDEQGLRDLMVYLAKEGFLEEAMEAGGELLKGAPGDAVALNNLGNIYFLKGDINGAIRNYESASQASPLDAGIWVNLARSYLRKGLKEKARTAFEKACALDGGVKDRYPEIAIGF